MEQEVAGRALTEAERRAVEYGIDLSLLDENLRLTPLQRIREMESARALVVELQHAAEKKYGRIAEAGPLSGGE